MMIDQPTLTAYSRAPSLGVSTWHFGALLTYLAESGDTAGSYSLLEADLRPGDEPPPHVHTREDELFYVLDGRFNAYVGEECFDVRAGGCIFMPRNKPHAFLFRAPRIHLLALFTPGGIEKAFRADCVPAPVLEPAAERAAPTAESAEQSRKRLSEVGVRLLTPDDIASQMPRYKYDLDASTAARL